MKKELIQKYLQTERFGRKILHLRAVNSTNDRAAELAKSGAEEGTLVVADSQNNGRGRSGRTWFSPFGGIYFSIVLRPMMSPVEASKIVFVAGLACARTLNKELGLKAQTKWPNDTLIDGKKVCGTLCEMKSRGNKTDYVVAGVGVNANLDVEIFSKELSCSAVSLKSRLCREVELERLLAALLFEFEVAYVKFSNAGIKPIIDDWKSFAGFLGKPVAVKSGCKLLKGKALDVNLEGALLLRLQDNKIEKIYSGDVQFLT
jgi:biotin-[acetyl-CoA-carboxylase] ligase BirA-like protein